MFLRSIFEPFLRRRKSVVESHRIMSLISPEEARGASLPPHAICGAFEGDGTSPETFRQNRAFVDLLHRVVRETAPTLPEFQGAARAERDGYVYVIDLRTPNGVHGDVPLEDIIGCFAVSNGEIDGDSYQAITEYRVYSDNGLTRLPGPLHAALLSAMRRP